jgi:hypothetical protein
MLTMEGELLVIDPGNRGTSPGGALLADNVVLKDRAQEWVSRNPRLFTVITFIAYRTNRPICVGVFRDCEEGSEELWIVVYDDREPEEYAEELRALGREVREAFPRDLMEDVAILYGKDAFSACGVPDPC